MRNLLILTLSLLLASGSVSFAASAPQETSQQVREKNIEKRLLELENQQREFEQWYSEYYLQSKNRVSPFLGEKISIGGFFETSMTHNEGPDTESQTVADSHALGINIAADFNDRLRFVSQYLAVLSYSFLNPNNNPGLTQPERTFGSVSFLSLVAQAYIEYRQNEAFNLQMGLGYAPFGVAFQQREPVLFKRFNGPQMLSAASAKSVGLAFPLWMGLHLQGIFPMQNGRSGYDLYTFSPSTDPEGLGGGSRLWWSNSQNFTIGVSAQTAEQLDSSYYSYGTDVNLEFEKWGLVSEYAKSVTSGDAPDIESYYVEPYINLVQGQWLIYAVADYINNQGNAVGAVADPYEVWEFGGGVNWLPIPNARFRLGALTHDYQKNTDTINGQRRDYFSIDFSMGAAF